MRLKPVLAIAVLLAASANRPCFAKDGHAQHGARTSAANNGTSGKGASGANPPANEANVSIDAGETVAPPVLPPHGQQQMRTSNPSAKIVVPINSSRGQAVRVRHQPRAIRSASRLFRRNFVGAQPPALPALQAWRRLAADRPWRPWRVCRAARATWHRSHKRRQRAEPRQHQWRDCGSAGHRSVGHRRTGSGPLRHQRHDRAEQALKQINEPDPSS
jgi:hypothetical protein